VVDAIVVASYTYAMQTASNTVAGTNGMTSYPKFELLHDQLDNKLVRFSRWTSQGFLMVMDRDTLKELPDERHHTQVTQADEYFRRSA
jgi:hypothetical protein